MQPVTEYLDPHDIWTPGPKYYEIFGPPLKYFIPHEAHAYKVITAIGELLGYLNKWAYN